MKISKLEIENFRGWQGKHEINFSIDPKERVTLILAENGTGKSNILEAIMWCLHGAMPSQSKDPEDKINKHAIKKNPHARAIVRLTVIDDKASQKSGNKFPVYQISRELKNKSDEPEAIVYEMIKGSKPKQYGKPRLLIDKLLPERLLKFFLYSGEGIEELFDDAEENLLKDSIEDMQGLTFARGALDDLKTYVETLTAEIGNSAKLSTRANKASLDLKTKTDRNEEISQEIGKLELEDGNLKKREKEIQKLIGESGHNKAKVTQSKITGIENNLKSKLSSKAKDEKKQISLLDQGSHIFLFEKKQKLNDFLDVNRKAEKIPSPHDRDAVNNILEGDRICICGRPIEEHSEEEKKLLSLLETSGTASQTENAKLISGFIDEIESRNKIFRDDYKACEAEINKVTNEIAQLNKELDALNEVLRAIGKKDIDDLLNEQDKNRTRQFDIYIEEEKLKNERNQNDKEIIELKKIINSASDVDETLSQKKDFLDECHGLLEDEIEFIQVEGRNTLLKKLNELAEKYDTKGQIFYYKNDSSYTPMMKDLEDVQLPENKGAEVLKDIFYAISLIDLCICRFNEKDTIIQPGTIAPMVCDAIFSDLSRSNRATAARLLSSIPEQTILMINADSYAGACKEVLDKAGAVGKSYFFQRRQTKKIDTSISKVEINGKKMDAFIVDKETSNTVKEIRL